MKTKRCTFAVLISLATAFTGTLGSSANAWQDPVHFNFGDGGAVSRDRVPAHGISWQDQDPNGVSRLDVPAAPGVDQSADPSGRPLSVFSNAATMPDDFYRRSRCNLGEPLRLVDRPDTGLRIGGWQQIGFHSRNDGLFNTRPDKLNLHQSWGFIEKEIQTNRAFQAKLRGDIVYGLDAQQLQAYGNQPLGAPTGWDNSWDNGAFGWALPQAYSDIQFDRLRIRAGRFLAPFGFETGAAVENFFYSRTFAFTNTQPHTLTGAVSDFQVNDTTSVILGATNGWDAAFDRISVTGLAGFTRQICGQSFFSYGSSFGNFGVRGVGYYQSVLYAYQATERLQLAVQSDWLTADQSDDYGFIGYGIFRLNPCLALGTRFEYWETNPAAGGGRQSANSMTTGLNYRPHANVVVRPEARYDWNTAAAAADRLNLGVDVVITF